MTQKTIFKFELPAQQDEIEALDSYVNTKQNAAILAREKDPLGFKIIHSGDGSIAIEANGHPDLAELCTAILNTCPSVLPFGFTYVVMTDPLVSPGCYGGHVIINPVLEGNNFKITDGLSDFSQILSIHRDEKPLTEIQKFIIEAYSFEDDGNLSDSVEGMNMEMAMHESFKIGDSLAGFLLAEAHDAGEDPGCKEDLLRMLISAKRSLENLCERLEDDFEDNSNKQEENHAS